MTVATNASKKRRFIDTSSLLTALKTLIYRLDKHVRRPRTGRRSITCVVIEARFCRLYLFHGHTFLDHVLHAITNDGDHVPIISNVSKVAESSMPRNDHSSAFIPGIRYRDVDDLVKCGDLAL